MLLSFVTCTSSYADSLETTDDESDLIVLGRSFFNIPWIAAPSATTARDGLGPHFNANTCASCHVDNGSAPTLTGEGQPLRPLLFKLSQPGRHSQRWQIDNPDTPFHDSVPDPVYGVQIGINATGNVTPEARPRLRAENVEFIYPDGRTLTLTRLLPYLEQLAYGPLAAETQISLRQPPALDGLGLFEQVAEEVILAWADPEDKDHDGISGRANWLQSPDASEPVLGRYNWKATEATLRGQIASAAAHDMGLTNPLYPQELCQPDQADCLAAPRGRTTPQGELDLPELRLQAMVAYVAGLQAPSQQAPSADALNSAATEGQALFAEIGCGGCHRASLNTAKGTVFHPYTDLLLHDMGEQLRDNRPEYQATASEFRTAPLWGLGRRLQAGGRFLHDARAATPEAAIIWHGGEAEASRNRFAQLTSRQRAALVSFLEHL